ncbi:hypothetical protein [Amycolatopsis nigrescens]|uniref:hypothetical protein n=1 Tax=Amycolatopsis nigrescens TaxID=381445 RepID=UPI00037767D1|nr:hypothetical protein [Amycolatopsis nigrescens]
MKLRPRTDVLIDVTSLISAEEFISAQNRRQTPGDPFARQCFVEIVQSIIFMSEVYVGHPVLQEPTKEDFGHRPLLLRRLMERSLVQPLRLGSSRQETARALEETMISDLESRHGLASMLRFADQVGTCDRAVAGGQQALADRLRLWCGFQDRQVRSVPGHHTTRIPTRDGVEDDAFGQWARAAAVVLDGPLSQIVPPGRGQYLMATLARGLKYKARAEAGSVSYQCHPIRRDFSLTFDLTRDGATNDLVLDLVQAVRGIHESLAEATGAEAAHRLRLVQLELPLLGGRLWAPEEAGRLDNDDWISLVVDRLAGYRAQVAELRAAVELCVSDEDHARLARDIDGVKHQLLERLGLRSVELSPMERELVDSVASVSQAAPGVPKVSGLWFSARTLGKRMRFAGKEPFQRFLYREFVDAWKRAGR